MQSGESPIHIAARYGHAHVIDFLCSSGADVNLQDKVSVLEKLERNVTVLSEYVYIDKARIVLKKLQGLKQI